MSVRIIFAHPLPTPMPEDINSSMPILAPTSTTKLSVEKSILENYLCFCNSSPTPPTPDPTPAPISAPSGLKSRKEDHNLPTTQSVGEKANPSCPSPTPSSSSLSTSRSPSPSEGPVPTTLSEMVNLKSTLL